MEIHRGEIYFADLNPSVGSEQGGFRPVLIVQNDVGNKYSPTTIIAPLTTRKTKASLPTHVWILNNKGYPTMILLEQVRTLDKSRLQDCIGKVKREDMELVDRALQISLGLPHEYQKAV